MERRISDLRQVINSDDTSRIRRLTEELQQAANQLGQMAQPQAEPQGGNPQGPQGGQGPSNEGDVVEGEFHEE